MVHNSNITSTELWSDRFGLWRGGAGGKFNKDFLEEMTTESKQVVVVVA